MSQDILLSKIVANPKEKTWSHAYAAVNLYMVIGIEQEHDHTIASLGKSLLEHITREFFALSEKNLVTIKQAVQHALDSFEGYHTISSSIVLCALVKDVCYLVIAQEGYVWLKRGQNTGVIAKGKTGGIVSFSGVLKDGDVLVLETDAFSQKVGEERLSSLITQHTVFDIGEALAPIVHEEARGTEAAIVLEYRKRNTTQEKPLETGIPTSGAAYLHERIKPHLFQRIAHHMLQKTKKILPPMPILPRGLPHVPLSKKRILALFLIIILTTILVGGVILEKKRARDQKTQKSPPTLPSPSPLPSLKNKKIIFDGTTFPTSPDLRSIATRKEEIVLMDTTHKELLFIPKKDTATVSRLATEGANGHLVTTDSSYVYVLGGSGVYRVEKESRRSQQIITVPQTDSIGALATFLGNIYLLNTKEGTIEKYPAPTFSKTSYIAADTRLVHPVSLAIDGSLWILEQDGTIKKFTKGKPEPFSPKGLSVPLSKNSLIYTEPQFQNLYIVDRDSQKMFILNKTGEYQNQINLQSFGSFSSFSVDEELQTVYLLSSNKLYSFEW